MQISTQSTPTFSEVQRAKPSFLGIVRSELVKITWLRSTWIMAMLVIFFTAVLFLLITTESRGILKSDPIQFTYDYILSQNFLFFQALTGFFALVVTVFAVGLDYQFGTIRVILGRGVGRLQFLLGKIVALFIFAFLVQVGGILLNGILLCATISMRTGSLSAMSLILSHFSGIFVQYFLYLIFNMWVSILLATVLTVIGRSLTFGMSAALLWFPLDNIGSTLLRLGSSLLPGDIMLKLTSYQLGPNLNVIPHTTISQNIHFEGIGQPFVAVDGLHTIVVTLVYAIIFLGIALVLTQLRDVQS